MDKVYAVKIGMELTGTAKEVFIHDFENIENAVVGIKSYLKEGAESSILKLSDERQVDLPPTDESQVDLPPADESQVRLLHDQFNHS